MHHAVHLICSTMIDEVIGARSRLSAMESELNFAVILILNHKGARTL